jgi:hypothetical protein
LSEGIIERDASAGVKRRFDENARERMFTDDEVRAFWNMPVPLVPAQSAAT